MKMHRILITLATAVMMAAAALAADFKKEIVGKWQLDLGGGYNADVTYGADGSYVQDMKGMTIKGTYAVKGNVLTLTIKGEKGDVTILSIDAKKMTQKRSDGKTSVLIRK